METKLTTNSEAHFRAVIPTGHALVPIKEYEALKEVLQAAMDIFPDFDDAYDNFTEPVDFLREKIKQYKEVIKIRPEIKTLESGGKQS